MTVSLTIAGLVWLFRVNVLVLTSHIMRVLRDSNKHLSAPSAVTGLKRSSDTWSSEPAGGQQLRSTRGLYSHLCSSLWRPQTLQRYSDYSAAVGCISAGAEPFSVCSKTFRNQKQRLLCSADCSTWMILHKIMNTNSPDDTVMQQQCLQSRSLQETLPANSLHASLKKLK